MAAALAMGCSNGSTGTDGGGNDTGSTDGGGTDAGAAHEYTFVLDQLTIDATDDPSVAHTGFNLDSLFSGANDMSGCFHQDFFSGVDQDQNCTTASVANGMCSGTPSCVGGGTTCTGGVDSQLPTLANTIQAAANTDIRATFANLLQNNQLSLLVRVKGITDDMNSPNVTVDIYLAYPTFSTGCTAGAPTNGVYTVAQSSLTAGATSIDQAAYTFPGKIVNGRLQATANAGGQFVLPLPPIMGHQIMLPLNAVQVRANISSSAIASGALGGWVAGTDVIAAVTAIAPSYASVVSSVIGGLVDIEINNVCDDETSTPHVYGGISLGLGLHGVPATISTTTPFAAAAAPGTCGASSTTDASGGNG